MSFDLYFWRQKAPLPVEPDEFIESLSEDQGSECVEPMSRDEVLAVFRKHFPDVEDAGLELNWEGEGSYFQASFSYDERKRPTSVHLSCGFELCRAPSFERLYEVAYDLGCRVYDPQSSKILVPAFHTGGLKALLALLTRKKWIVERA